MCSLKGGGGSVKKEGNSAKRKDKTKVLILNVLVW